MWTVVILFTVKLRLLLLLAVKTDSRLKLGSKVLYVVCVTDIHTMFMWSLLMVALIFQLLRIKLVTGDILPVLPVLIISCILLVSY